MDDDTNARRLLRLVLDSEPGLEILEASDGNDALVLCQSFSPDVAILDYRMPQMPGDRTAVLLKALHPQAKVLCIAAEVAEVPRGWADDYLSKEEAYFGGNLASVLMTLSDV